MKHLTIGTFNIIKIAATIVAILLYLIVTGTVTLTVISLETAFAIIVFILYSIFSLFIKI